MDKIAVLLKENLPHFTGEASLFLVDPPMTYEEYDDEKGARTVKTTKYITVSKTFAAFSGPETYIFPANADGSVKSWGELPGSQRGEVGINEALEDLGYTVSGN